MRQVRNKGASPKIVEMIPLSSSKTSSSKTAAKKRANAKEEKVSLIDYDGKPTPAPDERRSRQAASPPWTWTRLMRYMALMACSAIVTFLVLRKESQVLHWEEVHNLLEPEGTKEQRCYSLDRVGKDKRCTCPDPSKPQPVLGPDAQKWKNHHNDMVKDARNAPSNLDIVFLGDSITERWNGTRNFGTETIDGMRRAFESRFTKKGGGVFEGLALGSSGDTGPNLFWHLAHGVLEPLHPKVWFIHIGTNDQFVSKCSERFVVANILNVLKTIQQQRPAAQFVIHGILPRKEDPNKNSLFLGHNWKQTQSINFQLRKFCEKYSNINYLQGGSHFMEESDVRGRRSINKKMLEDGVHPTEAGLEVWGDFIVKRVTRILKYAKAAKEKGTTEET